MGWNRLFSILKPESHHWLFSKETDPEPIYHQLYGFQGASKASLKGAIYRTQKNRISRLRLHRQYFLVMPVGRCYRHPENWTIVFQLHGSVHTLQLPEEDCDCHQL